MTLTRSLTWNVFRHIYHDVKQLRLMCSVTSLYDQKGKWLTLLKRENLLEIEEIWKERVQTENENRQPSNIDTGDKEKFYVLSMFPYPSGQLHMGHVRVYTISDTMARYHRMLGHEVIHPMGWDAFGLPAENAAKERNLHPKEWTYRNISTMKKQLMNLCCTFDWDRELTTCDPAYYKWTQYIFLKMYEAGLTYQKHASVNWDPIDQTVLADEQIDEDGRSWRSGALAERRFLKQWYIKTTAYAKALYDGLDSVNEDLWADVIALQKHWIGQCTGCRLEFTVKNDSVDLEGNLSVFTDTPECIYGTSHITVDVSHRFNKQEYHKLVKKHPISGKDVIMLNLQAVHPLSDQLIPIVVTEIKQDDLVRKVTSSIGIPCVSEEERLIADLFDLSWQNVVSTDGEKEQMVNSKQFDCLPREDAKKAVMDFAREAGFGGYPTSKYLGDWLISRQRYWGTPIPIIHCDNCKAVPVPYEDLPVVLPDDIEVSNTKGGNPLQHHEEWVNVKCPACGGDAKRETDTMDTFVDSSWYFLRYLDSQNSSEPVFRSLANKYMPVDLYIGGKEHAQLHLYFARFFNYFLCDIGALDHKEPFVDLLTQGMVKGESFRVKKTGQYIAPSQAEKINDKKYVQKGTNEPLEVKFEKMSKSKLNGVDPEELFKTYGVDLTRLCILSGVAPRSDRNWNLVAYDGIQRWVNRVWYVAGVLVNRVQVTSTESDQELETWNQKIRKFRNGYLLEINQQINSGFVLNVVISRLQEFTTDLRKVPPEIAERSVEYERSVMDIVLIMAPLAPMVSSELWNALSKVVVNRDQYDFSKSVHGQKWPQVDPDVDIPISIKCNGRRIGHVYVKQRDTNTLTADSVLDLARETPFFKDMVADKPVVSKTLKCGGTFVLNTAVRGLKIESLEQKDEKKIKKKSKKKEKKSSQVDSV